MSGCAVRIPYFTVASNSADRLMRLRAGSTANEPDVAIRQITLGGPCGADWTRSNVQRGSAYVDGSRARGLGVGCSAGRSACPWSRRSPRCIELKTSEPSDHFTSTSVGSGLAAGRRGPQNTSFWVAAVSPTFGRLFEGTDQPSPGQTWPVPMVPPKHCANVRCRQNQPTRSPL